MAKPFPSDAWLDEFENILNSDEQYAEIAKNWEGDFMFAIEPDEGAQDETMYYYMDLWHGKCRSAKILTQDEEKDAHPAFILRAKRSEFIKVLSGKLDPMQAMLTRRLRLEGSMTYVLRNVPTVFDFVRCASKVGIAE
jgi:putative sterol carrier protein